MNKRFSLAAIGGTLATLGASAHAAVPEAITTALADMKADALTVAVAFIIVVISVAAVKKLKP